MSGAFTIEARSPALPDGIEVVIVLPTFRRPEHLLRTLDSLRRQRTRRAFAVVVVENDAEGRAGLRAAAPLFHGGAVHGLAIVAGERGNCHAYNAGWRCALDAFPAARSLLSIDDDECAVPDWIEHLLGTAAATGADLVGGPQIPVFEGGDRNRLSRHPVFTPHYNRTGPVPILYSSGNVLIRREVLEAMGEPFLDPGFNFTGGGDSDFYARASRRGFRFAWSREAAVHETTPSRRTEFSWLQARSLRNGALSSIIEHRADASAIGRARTLLKSLALLAMAPYRSLRLGLATGSATIGLYHLNVAVGRLLAEFGLINEQYRRPEQN